MSTPFTLSETGNSRATAYTESSKIISHQGKTHVAWLDSPKEGFRVKMRTLDQASGEWTDEVIIGEAIDNHGGPALTIDHEGHLHIVYFSHHHPFRYHRSVRPNDSSEWGPMEKFGTDLTYPTLICAKDGTLILSARRSHEEKPWELEVWKKAPGAEWVRHSTILRSDMIHYSAYAASMVWGQDHKTIYLGFRIYQHPDTTNTVSYTSVGFMMSPDEGETWTKYDGTPIELPAKEATVDLIMRSQSAEGRVLETGSIGLSPDGVPFIGYNIRMDHSSEAYLATPNPEGGWKHLYMNSFLPKEQRDESLMMAGGIAFKGNGQPVIVSPVVNLEDGKQYWGHVTTKLVRFDSEDGGATFTGKLIGHTTPSSPQWMPNLERPNGFNDVPANPSLIYTDGECGLDCDNMVQNKVLWTVLD
jgi:hypothetical protein